MVIHLDTPAALVCDAATGEVLLARHAGEPLPPASMSKLVVLHAAFEALQAGRLSEGDLIAVSDHAAGQRGSTMRLTPGERVAVGDLLAGAAVLSANDAAAALAEALSPDGTEAGFAAAATARVPALGLGKTRLANATGLPAPGHAMALADIATLSRRIIAEFPDRAPLFAMPGFAFDGRLGDLTGNRNPLLGAVPGADGLKTGYTPLAGHCLAGSVARGGRRVILVLWGLETEAARATEARRLADWAFDDARAPVSPGPALAAGFVQIGIFGVEANARNAASRLAGVGLVPRVEKKGARGKSWWRVSHGPCASAKERARALNLARSAGFTDAHAAPF